MIAAQVKVQPIDMVIFDAEALLGGIFHLIINHREVSPNC
jgi:hypothetical protein